MADLSGIVLEELREHRRDTKADFKEVFRRLASLEQTRSEYKGSKKTLVFMFGGSALGIISFIITLMGKMGHGP